MSHNFPRNKSIFHVDNIDGSKTGAIELAQLPLQKFYPSETIIEVTSSNALSGVPKISIGAPGTYDNLIEPQDLAGLLNANNMLTIFGGRGFSMQPGSQLCFNIINPAVGGSGLNYILRVILIGILI